MTGFFDRFKKSGGKDYNLWKLVDSSFVTSQLELENKSHIFCDIDKTYIETDFDTVFQMARMAFQAPEEKVTVSGASSFLQLCRWGDLSASYECGSDYPKALHFVSSSPPQLRSKLETKFSLDQLDWTSDTFKNQAYNLRKARFDLLRHQVTYKTAAVLSILSRFERSKDIFLVGDSSESDAFIYLGLKFFLEKRVSDADYRNYLEVLGVPQDSASALTEKFSGLSGNVKAIFIRQVPDRPIPSGNPLFDLVFTFENYFEATLLALHQGIIPPQSLRMVVRRFHNKHQMPLQKLAVTLALFKIQLPLNSSPLEEVEKVLQVIKPKEFGKLLGHEEAVQKKRGFSFGNGADNSSISHYPFEELDKHTGEWLKQIAQSKLAEDNAPKGGS